MTGAALTNACNVAGVRERTRPHHTPAMLSTTAVTDRLMQTIITLRAERDHLAAELETLQSKWNRVIESIRP